MSLSAFESRRAVGIWLLAVAAIITAMVVVGGLTRLTGSGLSITEWDPIVGAIPPLNHAEWMDAFHKYQQIPQYTRENAGMTLEGFKGIFWWEWSHRLLGRLIGVVFFLPFLWFAWRGAITRKEIPRMIVLFLLGGLQGFIGWWMVQSGLEVRVSVSQYRLAIHLGTALILFGAILWMALEYLRPKTDDARASHAKWGLAFAGLVYFQMLLGAIVAGLHAGLIYNTWPSMDGAFAPEGAFFFRPWWINFTENAGLAQFDHRMGAYLVGISAFALWLRGRRAHLSGLARTSGDLVLGVTGLQILLGILTLLHQVPEALAAFHQFTAVALLASALWHAYELRNHATAMRVQPAAAIA
jgi:cytochrome c oxidase assembly protein subunit 15